MITRVVFSAANIAKMSLYPAETGVFAGISAEYSAFLTRCGF
jgi:hypothetical protein